MSDLKEQFDYDHWANRRLFTLTAGLPERFALVGFSFGGMLAFEMLRQAQAQDLISFGDVYKPALQSGTSQLTRAEVEMQVSDLASMGKLYRNSNATQVYLN